MSGNRYYRRVKPGSGGTLKAGMAAGLLGASVAGISFYLVRLFLSRERLDPPRPRGSVVGDSEGERQDFAPS